MKDELSSGNGCFGKSYHFLQKGMAYFLFGNGLSAHELFKFLYVFITIECKTVSFATVTARSSSFLVVAFNTFWNIIMNNETNIRFVNSHSKSDCRNHHIYIFHQEHILMFYAGFAIKASVIGYSFNTVDL